jgi:hypothetical protein
MATTLLVAFFLPNGSFSHPGTAPFSPGVVPMISTAKHAFDSLRWYARQDAEAWKMLLFIGSVVLLSAAIASIS